jgi:ADP-heptose:LPS heptosyltransferase
MAGRVEQWLKGIGHAWLRRAAPLADAPPAPTDLDKVARILVVRLDDRLGNIVLLTPLLVALKGRFSRAHLSCLLARRYWDMREFIPSADEFISFDRAAMAYNPLKIRPLLKKLQASHYDLVFDASDDRSISFNHLMVTALSGGRFRVGHDRGEASRFYEVAVPVPVADSNRQPRHAAEMHLDLLRTVAPIRSHPRPLLKPPREDSGFAVEFRSGIGADTSVPLVLIHPGARGPKRWPASEFAKVARLLDERHDVIVAMVWGPADTSAAEEVQSLAEGAIYPVGILPFADLVSLIRNASVFVSGDCGPMHLAAAFNTPVVSIFLVSDAGKYRTLGANDVLFDARKQPFTSDDVAQAVQSIAVVSQRV